MLRCLAGILLFCVAALGQTGFYPFAIEQDQLSGAPDFSFLNRPLEPGDRIFVRDGHFCRLGPDLQPYTLDDERVRFFGVNLAFGANFPTEADAPRIARRLRRLGVNLVRLHHMDSQPDRDPNNAGSTLTRDPYPTLNPVAIARLRAFLDALKAEGIYANVNLHVGYEFNPSADQVPALAAFPKQSKPLHIFYPRMIDLQAEYAGKLLEALQLKDDPVLAMVEINNESSLLRDWQTNNLDRYLAVEYKTELARQWNQFLAARYDSTDALRAAWGGGEPDGPELLTGNWVIENHSPARGSDPELVAGESTPTVQVRILRGGNVVIVKQVGFSITTERPCVAEMEIRADLPPGESRSVYWDVKQNVSPWRTQIGKTIAVTGQWQKFRMAFQPTFAMDGIGRFGLSIEKLEGTAVYIRNWSLRQTGRRGLATGETLETRNIALVAEDEAATEARANDYLLFLVDRDRYYLRTILQAVKETTDELVPVAGTQMGYGGLLNIDSHADLDYADNHFYVDHYNFPNVQWDGRDWRIRDSSSLGSGLSSFQAMAVARQFGRPYTVSEFNQPWPNRQAAEIDPSLAAFAAFQDWDGIMHFAYSHGRGWDDGVPNGFNLNGDWTKFPNAGQSAWLFRSWAIRSGREVIDIPVSPEQRLRAGREKRNSAIGSFLTSLAGFDPAVCFLHPLRLVQDGEGSMAEAAKAAGPGPYASDTGEITYDRDGRLFLVYAPQAAGVFGYVEQKKVTAGAIDVELAPSARGFAAILVTSLDGEWLEDAERLLLSTPGTTFRSQPGSSPPRPQELVNYGSTTDWWTLEPEPNYPNKPSGNLNGGARPVWMERIESLVTLRTSAAGIAVYPLDGAGRRLAPLGTEDVQPVDGGFRIHLQAEGQAFSPWYEIIAERQISNTAPVSALVTCAR